MKNFKLHQNIFAWFFCLALIVSCKEKDKNSIYIDSNDNTVIFPTSSKELRADLKDEFTSPKALDLHIKARRHFHNENFDQAIQMLKKASQLESDNMHINHSLGLLFDAIGKTDSAKIYTMKAMEIDPTFDIAVNSYGLYLMNQDSLESARNYFDKAIKINPINEVFYLNKALTYCNQKFMKDSCCKYVSIAESYKSEISKEHIEKVKIRNGCE